MKIRLKFLMLVLVLFPALSIAQPVLYGTTSTEGFLGAGTVIKYDVRSKNVGTSAAFSDEATSAFMGQYPAGALILARNGLLYGLTTGGGIDGGGVLYYVNPNTYADGVLHSFVPATGHLPNSTKLFQASDEKLYGVTSGGGAYDKGVLYSYDINTNTYTKLVDFDGVNGTGPRSPLMELTPGLLYGAAWYGGSSDNGTIYKYSIADNVLTKIHDFDGSDGQWPIGSLVKADDGKLYGLTEYGGPEGGGLLYSIDPINDNYSIVKTFKASDGSTTPSGSPILASDGKIYWINYYSYPVTTYNFGGICSYSPATDEYRNLGGVAGGAVGTLVQASDGKLYGLSITGGIDGSFYGSIFSVDIYTNAIADEGYLEEDDGWWPVQEFGLVEIIDCDKTITATASGNGPLCNGSSLQLSASGGSSYYWKGPGNFTSTAQNPVINNVTSAHAGTYLVYVSNDPYFRYCYSLDSIVVEINQPDAAAISASTALGFCEGGSVTLTSSYATGNQWQRNGENITGATGNEHIATTAGTYRSVVTTAEGCVTNSNELEVVVNPAPATPVATAAGAVSFCEGGQVVISSSAATGNQWQLNGQPITGATGNQYTASAAGTYQVVVTNTEGCTAVSNSIVVTNISAPAKPVITANGPLAFCAGEQVILTSSAATGNQWQLNGQPITGATGSQYTAQAAGNYQVMVTNSGGCSATSEITAVTVNTLPAKPSISWNGSLLSTTPGFSNYIWRLDGQAIPGASTASITPTTDGEYNVTVFDNNGCSSTSDDFSLSLRASGDILFGETRIRVAPNPAIDNLRIQVFNADNKTVSMRLVTITGQPILTRQLPSHVTNIPIAHIAPGVYSLVLRVGEKQKTVQVLISH